MFYFPSFFTFYFFMVLRMSSEETYPHLFPQSRVLWAYFHQLSYTWRMLTRMVIELNFDASTHIHYAYFSEVSVSPWSWLHSRSTDPSNNIWFSLHVVSEYLNNQLLFMVKRASVVHDVLQAFNWQQMYDKCVCVCVCEDDDEIFGSVNDVICLIWLTWGQWWQ